MGQAGEKWDSIARQRSGRPGSAMQIQAEQDGAVSEISIRTGLNNTILKKITAPDRAAAVQTAPNMTRQNQAGCQQVRPALRDPHTARQGRRQAR